MKNYLCLSTIRIVTIFEKKGKLTFPHLIKVLEKCTKNLIGHSRLAFNNHESNIDC